MKRDLPGVSEMWTRQTHSVSTESSQPRSTPEQSETHLQKIFATKQPSFTLAMSWPSLSHATCEWILATSAAMSLTDLGSFNLSIDLRISAAWATTLSRGSAPFVTCSLVESQMTALTTALTGYIPNPRCYDKVSRVVGVTTNEHTLTTYETVSMGSHSGSISDKHCASNAITRLTLVILRCFTPFVIEL